MQPRPSLPHDFLTKVAKDYQLLDEELLGVFVECFGNNAEKNIDYIKDILNLSESSLKSRLRKIYDKFSEKVTFKRGPRKREKLHQFLLEQYQMEPYEKSQGSKIPDRPDTGKDIELLVQQAREMVRADIQYRCGTMKVMDMTYPIGLDDIYTHVNILETITEPKCTPSAELSQDCNAYDWERFELDKRTEERVPGLQAVAKYSKLIIWGKPGAGKTTFLKYLAIHCIEGKFLGDRIPIFITVSRFASSAKQPSLLDYILEWHNCGSLPEILESGKALVLLDGLDEVTEEDSHRVIEEILNFSDHYQFRHNHFVITCRIAAQKYKFKKFTEVKTADFDNTQIYNFAIKWFKNKDKTKIFINHIENNQRIQEIATNPLLLTLLCLSFANSKTGDFPATRSELYEEGLDVLLEEWDNERKIKRAQVYKRLSTQRKKDLLSKIALTTFEAGDYSFKQKEAERYITDYIRKLPGANTEEEALQLDSKAVLISIEAQHGLLIERAKGIYSFSHLTFHEYFTAREIIINQRSSEEALQKLVSHLMDRQWREVFLLATEMSSLADKLLLLMKHNADHLIDGCESLEQILDFVNNKIILGDESDLKEGLQLIQYFHGNFDNRSERFYPAIFIITNSLIFGFHHTILHLKFSQILNEDIACEFVMALIGFKISKNSTTWLGCLGTEDILGFWQSWSKEKKINNILKIIEFINVNEYIHSREEAKSVERYSYANQLLLDCLNSDCYVSREVREEIEETLLLPIAEIEKRKIEKRQSP